MEELERSETEANIAKLDAEAEFYKAKTKSLEFNDTLSIVKIGLSFGALAIAMITAIKHLMGA